MMPKFKYEWTVEETATDTRVWTVKANKKLDRTELQEIVTNTGTFGQEVEGEKYVEDNVESIFEKTIYGHTQWDFTLENKGE